MLRTLLSKRIVIVGTILSVLSLAILLLLTFNSTKSHQPQYTRPYHKEPEVRLVESPAVLLSKKFTDADYSHDSPEKAFLQKNALESGTIFVGNNCSISPVVTKTQRTTRLQLLNEGVLSTVITIDGKAYPLQPNQNTEISQSFSQSPSIVKISCGENKKISGYLSFLD